MKKRQHRAGGFLNVNMELYYQKNTIKVMMQALQTF